MSTEVDLSVARTQSESIPCCYIPPREQQRASHREAVAGCTATAVWYLIYGNGPEDSTYACERHLGDLAIGLPAWDIIRLNRLSHDSDCALHNMPAMPAEPCTCTLNLQRRAKAVEAIHG